MLAAFRSLGHGVRQMITSGLRPREPLRECSGFVTQHNLVILCPSVTGLLPKEGDALPLRVALSRVARLFFVIAPETGAPGSPVSALGLQVPKAAVKCVLRAVTPIFTEHTWYKQVSVRESS